MKKLIYAYVARLAILWVSTAGISAIAQNTEPTPKGLAQQTAVIAKGALKSSILAVARSGSRVIAVGDRGVVLLSDDEGATYRQAKLVPTRATLTTVSFTPDGSVGWAAGHWGVILVTTDRGETWRLQREDRTVDKPLFSILMLNASKGFAGGLWSLLLHTDDGGVTWQEAAVEKNAGSGGSSGGAGKNLFQIFSGRSGALFMAAEQGTVFRSDTGGKSWDAVGTGNKGTFWGGIGLKSGTLLVGGLSGKVYRSEDDGRTWAEVKLNTTSSVTGFSEGLSGQIYGVGLDGLLLTSTDDGRSFAMQHREGGPSLTSVISSPNGTELLFSDQGPLTSVPSVAAVAAR